MKKYKVLSRLSRKDGTKIPVGEIVSFPADTAKLLLDAGLIEEVKHDGVQAR
jgi:hypothetical protein